MNGSSPSPQPTPNPAPTPSTPRPTPAPTSPTSGGGGSPSPSPSPPPPTPPTSGGQCCYGGGCSSCNGAGEWCSTSRSACEGSCGGSYCSGPSSLAVNHR